MRIVININVLLKESYQNSFCKQKFTLFLRKSVDIASEKALSGNRTSYLQKTKESFLPLKS